MVTDLLAINEESSAAATATCCEVYVVGITMFDWVGSIVGRGSNAEDLLTISELGAVDTDIGFLLGFVVTDSWTILVGALAADTSFAKYVVLTKPIGWIDTAVGCGGAAVATDAFFV